MSTDRHDFEQTLWANLYTVAAGGALLDIYHRQTGFGHSDGVEIADVLAVGESETTISAALKTTSDGRSRPARGIAIVFGDLNRNIAAACTVQPRDLFRIGRPRCRGNWR